MSAVLDAVNKLNDEIFKKDEEAQATYIYETNGFYESVTFWGMPVWCSESADSDDEDNYLEAIRRNFKAMISPAI